jgi:hypothetical protein
LPPGGCGNRLYNAPHAYLEARLIETSNLTTREREHAIDDFLVRWNRRRQSPKGDEMFAATSPESEATLPAGQRILFRQVIGSFVDRFRPDRRDLRRRLENHAPLNDAAMSEALGEMGAEALKRHLGVALSPEEGTRLLETYRMSFLPPLMPMQKAAGS